MQNRIKNNLNCTTIVIPSILMKELRKSTTNASSDIIALAMSDIQSNDVERTQIIFE